MKYAIIDAELQLPTPQAPKNAIERILLVSCDNDSGDAWWCNVFFLFFVSLVDHNRPIKSKNLVLNRVHDSNVPHLDGFVFICFNFYLGPA